MIVGAFLAYYFRKRLINYANQVAQRLLAKQKAKEKTKPLPTQNAPIEPTA